MGFLPILLESRGESLGSSFMGLTAALATVRFANPAGESTFLDSAVSSGGDTHLKDEGPG